MHFYQFNIGDYQSHTGHLSELEDIAYRRMLDWCYLHEKPLPPDQDEIARLIRMRSHSECIAVVLREFFNETPDGWVSDRVMREIAAVNGKSEKARASANARWHANAQRPQSERNATQDTLPNTHDTGHKNRKADAPPPDGVSVEVWTDFVAHRKAKRAKLTATALESIKREATKAGWSLQDALAECCTRGWIGFKADWVAPAKGHAPARQAIHDERKATLDALTGRSTSNGQFDIIDV